MQLASSTLYNVQCTMYNVQCTMYNVHYTLYNVHYTMYNLQPSNIAYFLHLSRGFFYLEICKSVIESII